MQSLKNDKKKLKTKNEDKLTKDTVTPLNKISCKLASQFYGKMKFVAPTAEKGIKNAGFDEETTRLIYSIPFRVTKDTRLFNSRLHITSCPLLKMLPCSEICFSQANSAISAPRNKL